MKNFVKGAVIALALAGATVGTANAQTVRFAVGPGGARVAVTQGYYYDRYHHRHIYYHPNNWRQYHRPMAWYRAHNNWYRNHDWYR